MKEYLPIAIIIVLIVFLFFYYKSKYVYIKSQIDGNLYKVKNNSLSQESADLLANINKRLLNLVEYTNTILPVPVYCKNLEKFKEDTIHENILNIDTSYTVNKGEHIAFCVSPRSGDNIELYDLNTMMYVAIHELAHIASDSIGHTTEFKINFKNLLESSVKLGIYEYVDYSLYPIEYCGMTLTANVLS